MKFLNAFLLFAVLLLAVISAPRAAAELSTIQVDCTILSGETSQTETIDLAGVTVKDVVAYVPTLDSGDTSTVTLRATLNSLDYSPVGWTDKGIGATEDGALVKCLSSVGTIPSSGRAKITVWTSTAQASDRAWKVYLIVDN